MARRKQTKGTCHYCDREMTRGGLSRHLRSCSQRQEAIAAAGETNRKQQTVYHLQVEDSWSGRYWLHLEMNGDNTLKDLDYYLRAIWVECCGHLSGFRIGEDFYTQMFDDGLGVGDEKPMNVKVNKLFQSGMEIPYEYDFGTTTELNVKVVDRRTGKPTTKHPIALMARNNPPDIRCAICDQPATDLCIECLYETDFEEGELCEKHAEEHEHEEYLLPVVNSPRVGMCAYAGPAEPPY